VLKEINSPPPPAGTPGPFSLSDENILKDSFIKSGFKDVTIERMHVSFDFDSAEVFTSYVYKTAWPLQAMLANRTPEKRKEILKAVTQSARKYADDNTGTVRLRNEAICVVGER
jgi:hypothetical protein